MAFEHGRKSHVELDNAAGSLTDITAFCTDVSMPRSVDTAETSVFELTAKTYVLGMEDATVSLSGPFDPVIDLQMDALITALLSGAVITSATLQYDPQGDTTGLPRYTAEVLLTAYEPAGSTGDASRWSAEGQATGGVSRSTVP